MEQAQKSKHEQGKDKYEEKVIRILSEDIEGKINIYSGLTRIKGISWSTSNAICKTLGIDKSKKIGSLTNDEIKKLTEFIKGLDEKNIPFFLINKQNEFETGKNKHLTGTDLELKTEFDIKRLKKIKSYRGIRHSAGLPTRGQRTRSNFRKNRKKGVGIKKKSKAGKN